jgi:hypothetical protein
MLKDINKYKFLEEGYTPKCTSHPKAFKDASPEGDIIP